MLRRVPFAPDANLDGTSRTGTANMSAVTKNMTPLKALRIASVSFCSAATPASTLEDRATAARVSQCAPQADLGVLGKRTRDVVTQPRRKSHTTPQNAKKADGSSCRARLYWGSRLVFEGRMASAG